MYKMYFDRDAATIDGKLSVLEEVTGRYVFKQLRVRSGQRGWTKTSWVRGKSPIPFSHQVGDVPYLVTTRPMNRGALAGVAGIGEAFPVSTTAGSVDIVSPKTHQRRSEIMIHQENAYPGSRGCIVLVDPLQWQAFRLWMHQAGLRFETLPLVVL